MSEKDWPIEKQIALWKQRIQEIDAAARSCAVEVKWAQQRLERALAYVERCKVELQKLEEKQHLQSDDLDLEDLAQELFVDP